MLYNDFFEMEESHHLFELKTKDGLPLWDIIRLHVYLKYHYPKVIKPASLRKVSDYWDHIIGLIRSICYFIIKNGENLILPNSRYINSKRFLYDKSAMNVIEFFGKNSFILEWQEHTKKYAYSSANNYITILASFQRQKFSLEQDHFNKIANALNESFGVNRLTYNEINDLLTTFRSDYSAYKKFLKIKKTKRVFITQNGTQKALMKAAHDCGVKVYEFQHGQFEVDHLAYSYPDFISFRSNIIFPDYLLTFSEYWGSYFNVPAQKIVPIGNNYFSSVSKGVTTDGSILVISSMIHGQYLYPLAIELAEKYPEKEIKFKLHSNEYDQYPYYKDKFDMYQNISVLKNEKSIQELIALSELVILINSTVLYEALNQHKKVAIYRKENFEGQKSVFNFPNVFLFDQIDEIEKHLNVNEETSGFMFFRPFDKKEFQSILV
jgi:hypothetical protein